MSSTQTKALIASNNQGSKFQTSSSQYRTTAFFFHLSFTDFPTNAPIKAGVSHAA
jgi:hypothetical protein